MRCKSGVSGDRWEESLESSLAISQLNDVQGHLFMVFKNKFCSFVDLFSVPIALKRAQNYVIK